MKKALLLFIFLLGLCTLGLNAQDWGASPDDSVSVLGDWDISGDEIFNNTLVMTTPDPNRLFYRGGDKLKNYTVSADVKLLEMKDEAGFFPKYGFYPAYKDKENWIWVFIHPLEAENGISVVALVENIWVVLWETFVWGELDINFTEDNELKITKAGSQFTVYINEVEKASFEAAIDSAWVGLCTDAVRVNYSNFSVVNNDATAVTDLSSSIGVNLFPNPISDIVQINANFLIHDIEIYNLSGQKVAEKQINSNSSFYNVNSLRNGMYLMKINTERGVDVKKFHVRK